MKKFLSLLVLILLCLTSQAQDTSYTSLKGLIENKGQDLGQLECKWQKNGSAVFKADTKEANDIVKSKARFVVCDSLFLSTRDLTLQGYDLTNTYSPAWLLPDGRVIFIWMKKGSVPTDQIGTTGGVVGANIGGALGGALGGAISGAIGGLIQGKNAEKIEKKMYDKMMNTLRCCLYDGKSYDTHDVTPEEAEEILSANPAILREYQKLSKKEQKRGSVVLKYILSMRK